MKLDFVSLDKLVLTNINMRSAKRPPIITDLLPTIRKRGVLQSLIVRPIPPANGEPDHGTSQMFEIIAGRRRFHAATIVAAERAAEGGTGTDEPYLVPCAILDAQDDAAAIEASLIENLARLDPDEVTQWETFTRLVKHGQKPQEIAATFGLPDLAVRRILALGNLLPRVRALHAKGELDATTVRHLTMASKSQQKAWLALVDDPDAHAPTGHQLKSWLFGGQSIATRHALFDVAASGLETIANLFGEDSYFANAQGFWDAQDAAIAERSKVYLEAGWSEVTVMDKGDHFHSWEFEKAPKRKGGRIYVEIRQTGEVIVHEGYVTRSEARRMASGQDGRDVPQKPARPELSGPVQTYVDLHRHAVVRAELLGHQGLAFRLMVAHAIAGSPLWTVRPEPQSTRNEQVSESLCTSPAEARFSDARQAVLGLLGLDEGHASLVGSRDRSATALLQRLIALPDAAVMDICALAMGETLAAGSEMVEAIGVHLAVDPGAHWQADVVMTDLIRDREMLLALVAELAGERVTAANAKEPTKILRQIIRDHVEGTNGRSAATGWCPRWMRFPPSAYTSRGGVGTVEAHRRMISEIAGSEAQPDENMKGAMIVDAPEFVEADAVSEADDRLAA